MLKSWKQAKRNCRVILNMQIIFTDQNETGENWLLTYLPEHGYITWPNVRQARQLSAIWLGWISPCQYQLFCHLSTNTQMILGKMISESFTNLFSTGGGCYIRIKTNMMLLFFRYSISIIIGKLTTVNMYPDTGFFFLVFFLLIYLLLLHFF